MIETDETRRERRLAHEAATVNLGTLYACDPKDVTDSCRVEVTYGHDVVDDFNGPIGVTPPMEEHCGFYIVHVATAEGGAHPADLATEKVHEHVEPSHYAYFSVDDVYAA